MDGESNEARLERITEYAAESRQMVLEAHSIITAANQDVVPPEKLGDFLEKKLLEQNNARDTAMTNLEAADTDFLQAINSSDKENWIKAFKDHTNRVNDIVREAIIQMMEAREGVCDHCLSPTFEELSPELEQVIISKKIAERQPICQEFIATSNFENNVKQLAREMILIHETFERSLSEANRHIMSPTNTDVCLRSVHGLRVYTSHVCDTPLERPITVYKGTLDSFSRIEKDFLRDFNLVNISLS